MKGEQGDKGPPGPPGPPAPVEGGKPARHYNFWHSSGPWTWQQLNLNWDTVGGGTQKPSSHGILEFSEINIIYMKSGFFLFKYY